MAIQAAQIGTEITIDPEKTKGTGIKITITNYNNQYIMEYLITNESYMEGKNGKIISIAPQKK